MTFDFASHLVDHPAITENLPDDFKLEFIEKDFPTIEKKDQITNDSNVKKKYVRVRNTIELPK